MGNGSLWHMTALLLALVVTAPPAPTHLKVDIEYMLTGPSGALATKPQTVSWFFELPAARANDAAMRELIHRIFFDANKVMKDREPGDPNWLAMTSFKSSPVDPKSMLTVEKISDLPWHKAWASVVWEPSCCYLVDDKGNYDTLKGGELTELFAHRMVEAKTLDEAGFIAFFDRHSPGKGKTFWDDRANRFKNLTAIRSDPTKRKPGSKPEVSWPAPAPTAAPKKKGQP